MIAAVARRAVARAGRAAFFGVLLCGSSALALAACSPPSRPRDGDCSDLVCSSKADMFRIATSATSTQKRNLSTAPKDTCPYVEGCPADKDELGAHTWTMLHTAAAYYPEEPSAEEQEAARQLIKSLTVLYPCKVCAFYLKEHFENEPPDVSTREGFAKWLCDHHNRVNIYAGKPEFPCTMEELDLRWKIGRPHCWEGDEPTEMIE